MEFVHGIMNKETAANILEKVISKYEAEEGYFCFGFPVVATYQGAFTLDGVWLSKKKGLLLFHFLESEKLGDYKKIQDDCYNKITSRLLNHSELIEQRKLCVPIHVVTFAPLINKVDFDEDYPVCNQETLCGWVDSLSWDGKKYQEVLSVIQSVSTIRQSKSLRNISIPNSKGAKLKALEDTISTLDKYQNKAVFETVKGVQRIRGLAGSGKTIVLALKVAYLHTYHPDWNIAVTFHTRSLKGQFKELINKFVISLKQEEPNWANIHILNSWGAPGDTKRHGMYYLFCQKNGIEYLDYSAARMLYKRNHELEGVCEKALSECHLVSPEFDVILVDEAQDLPPVFLKMCYEFLKEPKRMVYAYDELQSLNENMLPSPELIFGNDEFGHPLVNMKQEEGKPNPDIILKTCYRNSRPALVTAHALGFGIYRKADEKLGTGIIQMFENRKLWHDIGYENQTGDLEDGKKACLVRTSASSPEFLEQHSPLEDLIDFQCFQNKEEQDQWVATHIIQNIKEEELKENDIIVINPNPRTSKEALANIRSILFQKRIQTHMAGVDTSTDVFFQEKSIVFTGIFRAKGNEAAMVYIVNAQDCYQAFGSLAKVRNELFTAITRSKAWVRVCGFGKDMELLKEEFEQLKKHKFALTFDYPTEEQRKEMKIVNRDMSEEEKRKVKEGRNIATSFLQGLENGDLRKEDLDAETLRKIKLLLDGGIGDE